MEIKKNPEIKRKTEAVTRREFGKTITRREFIIGLIGASIAAITIAPIVALLKSVWPPGAALGAEEVEVASIEEIPKGTVKEKWKFLGFPAILIHDEGGVVNQGEETINAPIGSKVEPIRAFAVKCPHLGCTAQWRETYSGFKGPIIFCPCHDGVFDPKAARVLAGPPPAPLPEIKLEIKGGKIYALAWKNPKFVETLEVYKV